MANSLQVNPIIVTAAMAQTWKTAVATALGTFQDLRVEKIYWEAPVTPGDTVVITDGITPDIKATMRCELAFQSQVLDWTAKPKRWRDFQVGTIASGVLYIYLA